jgi:hypothetical protein
MTAGTAASRAAPRRRFSRHRSEQPWTFRRWRPHGALIVKPNLMQALIWEQSGGEPWSFSLPGERERSTSGILSFANTLADLIRIAADRREELASVGELDCLHAVGNRQQVLQVEGLNAVAGPPPCSPSETRTAASSACSPWWTLNWTRQRKIMLVAILWRRQTAAALTPGCSASITIASFSASVKLRQFDRLSHAGAAVAASVKLFSSSCSLAALPALLLIVARTLG